ncbi:MAG: vWA domain-containing protein, partial [Gammaproteobacteria bacterium]
MIRAPYLLQLILCLTVLYGSAANAAERDIVLLLDNAASMKASDPGGLAKQAVGQLIGSLPPDASLTMLTFGESVQLVARFTAAGDAGSRTLVDALNAWDYSAPYGNSAAGMERSIYELKSNARDGAAKAIVLFSGGKINTGNPELDQQYAQWLSEILGAEAAAAGISVHAADLSPVDTGAIRKVTEQTGGSYNRITDIADLGEALTTIGATLGGGRVAVVTAPTPAPATTGLEQIEVQPEISLPAPSPAPVPETPPAVEPPAPAPSPPATPETAQPQPAATSPPPLAEPTPVTTATGQSNMLQWIFLAAATLGLFALTMVGLSILRQRASVATDQTDLEPDDSFILDETGALDATAVSEEISIAERTESEGVPSGAVAAAAGLTAPEPPAME